MNVIFTIDHYDLIIDVYYENNISDPNKKQIEVFKYLKVDDDNTIPMHNRLHLYNGGFICPLINNQISKEHVEYGLISQYDIYDDELIIKINQMLKLKMFL